MLILSEGIRVWRDSSLKGFKCEGIQVWRDSSLKGFKSERIQVYNNSSEEILWLIQKAIQFRKGSFRRDFKLNG